MSVGGFARIVMGVGGICDVRAVWTRRREWSYEEGFHVERRGSTEFFRYVCGGATYVRTTSSSCVEGLINPLLYGVVRV